MGYFGYFNTYLCLIILLLGSCLPKKVNKSNHEIQFIRKTETINQNILGKKLNSLNLILGDSIILNEKIVLLITVGSDCSGCRTKGYQFITSINNIYKNKTAFVIGTGLGMGSEKKNNSLNDKLYIDELSIIKQELNLFHTPSVVLLDKNGIVDKILGIFPYDDVEGYNEEKKFDEFLEAVLAL